MNPQSRFAQTLILILLALLGVANTHAAVNINYVVNNHLGAPVLLVDENQHVVWQAEYDEFGKATILVEEVEFNVRFPGQYYDKETGLTYNYYRDYDAEKGRYVQSDPIGILKNYNDPQMQVAMQMGVPLRGANGVYGELNHTYGYVGGNPINLSDPFGLCPMCAVLLPYVPAAIATAEAVATAAAIYGASVIGGEIGDAIVGDTGFGDEPAANETERECVFSCNATYTEDIKQCNTMACENDDQRLQCLSFASKKWEACKFRCQL